MARRGIDVLDPLGPSGGEGLRGLELADAAVDVLGQGELVCFGEPADELDRGLQLGRARGHFFGRAEYLETSAEAVAEQPGARAADDRFGELCLCRGRGCKGCQVLEYGNGLVGRLAAVEQLPEEVAPRAGMGIGLYQRSGTSTTRCG